MRTNDAVQSARCRCNASTENAAAARSCGQVSYCVRRYAVPSCRFDQFSTTKDIGETFLENSSRSCKFSKWRKGGDVKVSFEAEELEINPALLTGKFISPVVKNDPEFGDSKIMKLFD